MKRFTTSTLLAAATIVLNLLVLFSPRIVQAAPDDMSNFCSIPPFVATGTKPNLLLMIDNSASMYDMAYTDTSNYYCANAANTSCTQGSTCSGTAYCLASATTTTTTSTTGGTHPSCTSDANCNNIVGDCVLPSCSSDSDCGGISGDCWKTGSGHTNKCKTYKGCATYTTPLVSTTTVSTSPISCTQDSDCTIAPNDSCNNKCNVTHSCFDNTYSNTTGTYSGYFSTSDTYYYNSTSGKFTGGATMPGTCAYSASSGSKYLCINTTTSGGVTTITADATGFVATGNFLNWLTMSKFDIEKQILTGGKYVGSNLIAETRGCSGRKYVKVVPTADFSPYDSGGPGITFAIRGGSYTGLNKITSPATEYGQSYIEIYTGQYNAAACNAAVNDWMNVNTTNLGTVQKDTGDCIGASGNASAPLVAYNQTVHDCFWYFNGHGLSNLQVIQKNCVSDWGTVDPTAITSPDSADAICSSVLQHTDSIIWPSDATNTGAALGTGTPVAQDVYNHGYLGLCYNASTGNWDAAGGYPDSGGTTCSYKEEADYCASLGAGAGGVTDPASSSTISGTGSTLQSVPGFVMESGLYGLTSIGTATVQVGQATPPIGLINVYKDSILFGAMTFNNNGSGYECSPGSTLTNTGHCSETTATSCSADTGCPSGEKCVFDIPCPSACNNTTPPFTRSCSSDGDCPNVGTPPFCVPLPKADGGHVVSPIGGTCSESGGFCTDDANCPSYTSGETCVISVGDHTTGLINSIDSIVASTWTPFAEGFYDAIGYYARTSSGNSKDFRFQQGTCNSWPTLVCKQDSDCPSGSCSTGSTHGDYDLTKNPTSAWCRSNNILLITDGMSTADLDSKSETLASSIASSVTGSYNGVTGYNSGAKCPSYLGSRSLPSLAWAAHNRNISDSAFTSSVVTSATTTYNNQSINTYIVYSGQTSTSPNLCDPYNLLNWTAKNGGTSLLTASNISQLYANVNLALGGIAAKAASGSAVSVLTTSARGVGSMLQAYFYPTLQLGTGKQIQWLGFVQNIWIDPTDNLRDDYSGGATPDAQLKLAEDRVMMFNTDPASNATKAALFSTMADGTGGGLASCQSSTVIDFNQVVPIWEGGKILAQTSALSRNIFTAIPGGTGMNTAGGLTFNTSNVSAFSAALNPDPVYTAGSIVDYTLGYALEKNIMSSGATYTTTLASGATNSLFRDRTLDGWVSSSPTTSLWKLGDVINSTPKVVGNIPQNTYFIDYGDQTYYKFMSSDLFQHRQSVALIGSNDGMLHAFKVGYLVDTGLTGDVKALFQNLFTDTNHDQLGKELWGYIPYNVLPYLKYYAQPSYTGCHIYAVDLTVKLVDASIGADPTLAKAGDGSSWRTILIGGLRFGGACNNSSYPYPINGATGNPDGGPNGPPNPSSGVGYSSYFALDLTNYLAGTDSLPTPLWEFTDADLGYTTSAPGILRTGDPGVNGNWYVVVGSGPTQLPRTNPNMDIDRNHTGYIYILDMKTGTLVKKIGLGHSSIVSDILSIDANKDYFTEKIYFGTAWKNGSIWAGDIMSLATVTDMTSLCGSGTGPFTGCSALTTLFSDNYPFTASPDSAKDENGNVWVYAGSGKYYSSLDEQDSSPQVFVGFIDNNKQVVAAPIIGSCPSSCPSTTTELCNVSDCQTTGVVPTQGGTTQVCVFSGQTSTLETVVTMVSNPTNSAPQSTIGWMINLPNNKERVISRPMAAGGVVDFLSYVPSSSVCTKGGNSYLYALDYVRGVAPSNVAIRAYGATTSGGVPAASGTVVVQPSVLLGPGAPPTGEAIIVTPPKEGQDKLKKKIQISTGVIVQSENKPVLSVVSKVINWLKK